MPVCSNALAVQVHQDHLNENRMCWRNFVRVALLSFWQFLPNTGVVDLMCRFPEQSCSDMLLQTSFVRNLYVYTKIFNLTANNPACIYNERVEHFRGQYRNAFKHKLAVILFNSLQSRLPTVLNFDFCLSAYFLKKHVYTESCINWWLY